MQVSATAVKDLCAHKRHLGALPGMLSVLHTWNGRLGYHPHVHLLITGGGITPDGQHWEPARGEYLVPVSVLSRKIAAQFRAALKAAAPAIFADIPASVWQREWVSFCKHYGHGNDAVLTYLSRYVFRTAISNARILGMDQSHVTFRWKDRSADRWRTEQIVEYGNARMIRTDSHKLILRYPFGGIRYPDEFYDLKADPRETVDRIDDPQMSGLVKELTAKVDEYFAKYSEPEHDGLTMESQPRCTPASPWLRGLKAPAAKGAEK